MLYVLFTAVTWAAVVAAFLPFPYVSVFSILIQFFVMAPLVVFALTGAINRLANAQRSAP